MEYRVFPACGDAHQWQPQEMCPNCVTPWKCNGPHEPQDVCPCGAWCERDESGRIVAYERPAPTPRPKEKSTS